MFVSIICFNWILSLFMSEVSFNGRFECKKKAFGAIFAGGTQIPKNLAGILSRNHFEGRRDQNFLIGFSPSFLR